MPRTRKEVQNIEELVRSKKKKYVRYAEGAELFSMGLHSFQSLAVFRIVLQCQRRVLQPQMNWQNRHKD